MLLAAWGSPWRTVTVVHVLVMLLLSLAVPIQRLLQKTLNISRGCGGHAAVLPVLLLLPIKPVPEYKRTDGRYSA
jgi:hypothetical protein